MTRFDPIMASPANYWGSIAADVSVGGGALVAAFATGSLAPTFAAILAGVFGTVHS